MAEQLADWMDERFVDAVLSKHPAPVGPDRVDAETGRVVVGERLWESGMRLHGNQRVVTLSRARFKQVGGGWRGGKSVVSALHIYLDMMWRVFVRGARDDLWGVLADTYAMAEEEMRHLSRFLTEAGIAHDFKAPTNQSWRITVPGWAVEVVTMTASDVTKIASRPYRGIVIAEAAQTVYAAFENAMGRVSETRGWVLLSGTFEATKGPWYHQLADSWMKPGAWGEFYSLPTWENLVVYPGGREDPEIVSAEKRMAPTTFMEKYGGVPMKRADVAMVGADERFQVRHRYPRLRTSYDPEQPVYLFCDPGIAHAYAVFPVQFVGSGKLGEYMGATAWVIDAVYRWNRSAQEILAECASRPWASRVETAVMDFAARQRRAEGPPIVEQWAKGWREATGQPLHIVANPVPLSAGYDIHKRALLNTWPEDEANRVFNPEGKLRQFLDPDGARLYFDPIAAAPMFGGMVDGVQYAGEYNLHRMRKNREGTVTSDDYVDTDNDGVKALNYGLYWHFGAAGQAHRRSRVGSVPWELVAS